MRERKRERGRREREEGREEVYRVIKFHYRAVAIDCFRARANKHSAEPMKLLSLSPLAAISTPVFANKYASTDYICVFGIRTLRFC